MNNSTERFFKFSLSHLIRMVSNYTVIACSKKISFVINSSGEQCHEKLQKGVGK